MMRTMGTMTLMLIELWPLESPEPEVLLLALPLPLLGPSVVLDINMEMCGDTVRNMICRRRG